MAIDADLKRLAKVKKPAAVNSASEQMSAQCQDRAPWARAGTEPESLAQSEMEIGLLECLALGA